MDRGLSRVLVGGVAAAVGYTLWAKTTAVNNLVVKDFKYQSLEWSGLSGVLHLIMPIQNVSNTSLTFTGFSGWIYYKVGSQTKDLLPVTIDQRQTIKAHETTMIPVAIDLSVLSLGASILDMIKSKSWLKNAFVRGNILVGALSFKTDNKIF